jgi:hypothetical protein
MKAVHGAFSSGRVGSRESMIHFLLRFRQDELQGNSVNSGEFILFSLDFTWCSLAFFNVKEKMRDVGKD